MNNTIDFLQNQGFMLILLHKGQFMKKDIIFWDVDTQFDFMRAKGKLYAPPTAGFDWNPALLGR